MTLRYTPAAIDDLRALRAYLVEKFGSDVAQEKVGKLLMDISSLKDFPGLMRSLADKIKRASNYKYFLCGKHSVAILFCE